MIKLARYFEILAGVLLIQLVAPLNSIDIISLSRSWSKSVGDIKAQIPVELHAQLDQPDPCGTVSARTCPPSQDSLRF